MARIAQKSSPFLTPGVISSPSSLAVLHLRRDQLLPVFLRNDESIDSGYAEGHVTNTRFGSYPHSTLIGLPWGSQVVASQVDTGSRGRREGTKGSKKRKNIGTAANDGQNKKLKVQDEHDVTVDENGRKDTDVTATQDNSHDTQGDTPTTEARPSILKQPSAASSGFCHIMPPTPESWTVSLPHRTQVVYTPDYSYIIQKMRIRPGSIVIEAGAGSGSFTHAAARAAFNGYPPDDTASPTSPSPDTSQQANQTPKPVGSCGQIYSYEYHASRAAQLRSEICTHGLDFLIQITHRDVYTSGFLLAPQSASVQNDTPGAGPVSPNASHIFLDLPSPWNALPHLTRGTPSALDAKKPVHICIFLPCIEQVQRAVAALRTHGWVEISMQQLAHRRFDVRREKVGLQFQGLKGVNAVPASVDEACARLFEVEMHGRRFQNRMLAKRGAASRKDASEEDTALKKDTPVEDGEENRWAVDGAGGVRAGKESQTGPWGKPGAADGEDDDGERRPWFRQGRLVHRTEPEIRTHTSYLIFAVLPRAWE